MSHTKWLAGVLVALFTCAIACLPTTATVNRQHPEEGAKKVYDSHFPCRSECGGSNSSCQASCELSEEMWAITQVRIQEQLDQPTLWTLANINKELSSYGAFLSTGMNLKDYRAAMNYEWEEVVPTGELQALTIDLMRPYAFKDLELFMIDLARYDGVRLFIIGQSVQGRKIYGLSIDLQSTGQAHKSEKPGLLFTGQVHANEFAGSLYILKQFSDILKEAQTNAYTRSVLEQVRLEAIPVLNPDMREKNMAEGSVTRKSNANGVDLNRNFPSVSACQLANGIRRTSYFSTGPALAYYPGPSLGSEPETRAAIKWLETYVPNAAYYLDYHQQGRGLYYGKPWDTADGERMNIAAGKEIVNFLNTGVTVRQYIHLPNQAHIGFEGSGGTITDYALSIARGLTYSPKYGILTLGIEGNDTPLLKFKDLDNHLLYYAPLNAQFCTTTVEITRQEGYGQPLGYGPEARRLMNEEYYKHNYDRLILFLAEKALGKPR